MAGKPTVTATTGAGFVTVIVTITSVSSLLRMDLFKRETGSGAPWVRIMSSINYPMNYVDYGVRAGTSYDYYAQTFVTAGTAYASDTAVSKSFTLMGMWLHDPLDVTTLRQFAYKQGDLAENLAVQSAGFSFLGRTNTVYEFGDHEDHDLSFSIVIPNGTGHGAAVKWWRDRIRARRTLIYRDNRTRMLPSILGKVTLSDTKVGTTVKGDLVAVDYTEAV